MVIGGVANSDKLWKIFALIFGGLTIAQEMWDAVPVLLILKNLGQKHNRKMWLLISETNFGKTIMHS